MIILEWITNKWKEKGSVEMMREILFRGKRKDNGEWVEGDLRQDKDTGASYISGWNYYTDIVQALSVNRLKTLMELNQEVKER